MDKTEKTIYFIIMATIQLVQMTIIFIISYFNDAFLEFIAMYIGMVIARIFFGDTWHAKTILGCTIFSATLFYVLTKATLSLSISLFFSLFLGIGITYYLSNYKTLQKIYEDYEKSCKKLTNFNEQEIIDLCKKSEYPDEYALIFIDRVCNKMKIETIADKYNYCDRQIYRICNKVFNKIKKATKK